MCFYNEEEIRNERREINSKKKNLYIVDTKFRMSI